MSVLRLSYRYLSAVQQRVFRLLSVHRGPDFDAYSAAALTGLSLDEAENCLDALFEDNLLRQDVVGRFHFHDLIRDCSRQLLIETETDLEQRAAQKSLLDYYLHAAYSWCGHLGVAVYRMTPQEIGEPAHTRVVESREDAVRILDAEYGNLVATARSASTDNWNSHAWQLTCILQPYLKLTNYGEVALALFRDGLRAARAVRDLRGQSACLHGLALICQERRSYAEAREHLREAIALSREIGDPIREGVQLVTLGSLYLNDDHLVEARDAWLAAEAIGVSNSDRHLRATTLNNLGTIFRDLGEFDQALECFERSMAEGLLNNPNLSRPQIPWNIGMVYHFQGKQHEAIHEFKQALRLSTAAQFHHGKALALASLCGVHRSLGKFTEALDYGRRALSIARDFTLRVPECAALCALGEVVVSTGDLDRAEEVYSQAETRAREYHHPRYVARSMEGFAHIAFARGLLPDARRNWEQAIRAYPDGMAAAEYPRRHLASLTDESTRCFRCESQTPRR
jgi:tetratricopeptide (TPR) repeat protein